uniref:Uncharacterized protein n=1 Tax=Glossina brevipalpis TaxID=37001 RepID=A0A1A9X3B4_9MUSC
MSKANKQPSSRHAESQSFKLEVVTLESEIISLYTQLDALELNNSQLTTENETLLKENKTLKLQVRDLTKKSQECRQIVKNESQELSTMSYAKDLENLVAKDTGRYKNEFENIQKEYKQLQMENSKLKLQNIEMTDMLFDRINQNKLLETQYSQEAQHCQMLVKQTRNLNKALIENLLIMSNILINFNFFLLRLCNDLFSQLFKTKIVY